MTEPHEQVVDDGTASEDQVANGEAASEHPSASNAATANQPVASNRSRLGFLSLPAEVRLMVYRDMFHWPHDMGFVRCHVLPVPALLATCKLIHNEAFDVLWGENEYFWVARPALPPNLFQRIVDTMQMVAFHITCRGPTARFIELIQEFGNPTRIRDALKITFYLVFGGDPLDRRPLQWFLAGLGRFTNFTMVELNIQYRLEPLHADAYLPQWMAEVLQPRLGPATPRADNCALLFHPQDYLNAQPSQEIVDWMDLLDGIRLD